MIGVGGDRNGSWRLNCALILKGTEPLVLGLKQGLEQLNGSEFPMTQLLLPLSTSADVQARCRGSFVGTPTATAEAAAAAVA